MLFDIDGTLLDHDGASRAALHSRIASLDARPDPADAGLVWRELEELHYNEYLAGLTDLEEQRRRRARDFVAHYGGGNLGDAEAAAWYDAYLDGYRAAWELFEDVPPLLEHLGGIEPGPRLGAVTNADGYYQRGKLRTVGLHMLLENFTASSEAPAAKPDPRIFVQACAGLQLDPGEVAYVGDRLDVDAEGAAAAGLVAVWLDRLSADPPPHSVIRITGLDQLPAAIGL